MPSYLLNLTKFLGEISQFEFLVMAEKNIFAYKLFLSLNISDFNLLFFLKIANCPLKSHPPSFPARPSKNWGPVKPPPFLKIWLEVQPPPPSRKGGAHYDTFHKIIKPKIYWKFSQQ